MLSNGSLGAKVQGFLHMSIERPVHLYCYLLVYNVANDKTSENIRLVRPAVTQRGLENSGDATRK